MRARSQVALPIYDPAIERAILGAVFQEPDDTLALVMRTRPEQFFDEKHRAIRAAIGRVQAAGAPVDMLIVSAELSVCGELDAVGGTPYLAQLFEEGAIPAHVPGYITTLLDLWAKRRLQQLSLMLTTHVTNGATSAELVRAVTDTLGELEAVRRESSSAPWVSASARSSLRASSTSSPRSTSTSCGR